MSNLESQIQKLLEQRFDRFVHSLAAEYQERVTENRYWDGWDRTTRRRNGEVVSNPRNIVDTGELRDSLYIEVEKSRASISWEADHAAHVFIGDVGKPGRAWTDLTMSEIEYENGVRQLFRDS